MNQMKTCHLAKPFSRFFCLHWKRRALVSNLKLGSKRWGLWRETEKPFVNHVQLARELKNKRLRLANFKRNWREIEKEGKEGREEKGFRLRRDSNPLHSFLGTRNRIVATSRIRTHDQDKDTYPTTCFQLSLGSVPCKTYLRSEHLVKKNLSRWNVTDGQVDCVLW